MAKIAIVSHYSPSLINFRGDLIRAMVYLGHEVICLGPEAGFEQPLQELGASYRQISLNRTGLNPFQDLGTLFSLKKVFQETRPDTAFSL